MASAVLFSDNSGGEMQDDQSKKLQDGARLSNMGDCLGSEPKRSRLDFSSLANGQPPIELSIDLSSNKKYETVERRYFKRHYKMQEDGEDQVVLLHSNRICLVSIAPKHPIIQNNLRIANLEFEVGRKSKPTDRLSNKVSGKGKKGGQSIDERAILCWVHCENGSKYAIRSCVRGTLIEINPLVVKNPQLLAEKPLSDGHLAVILPKLPEGLERLKTELYTEEQYNTRTDSCA